MKHGIQQKNISIKSFWNNDKSCAVKDERKIENNECLKIMILKY